MKDNHFLLEEQLCFSAYTLSRYFTRMYRSVLDPYGLTYPQYVTLLVLWEKGERSIHELGEELRLDSGTLTPMLKRMEARGYITRTRNPEDERRMMIALTDQANDLKDELLEKVSGCLDKLEMQDKEYFQLLEQLNELTEKLGGINDG